MYKNIIIILSILLSGVITNRIYASASIQSYNSIQQNDRISGIVKDDSGSIAGASISIKGTAIGTASDADGHFTLKDIPENAVIVVSFIGFKTQEIVYKGQTILNIKLTEASLDLDEIMVTAYGTTKKSSFTGSASIINADALSKITGTGFTESLQGLSTGLYIANTHGNPGADTRMEIRGISSISGYSPPLIILDGMPFDGGLNQINPADIKSINVLKDAVGTSLYGSRAANGVLMISTQKGKAGKPKINFRGSWGTSDNAVKNPKKADPYQQLENVWYALYYDAVYIEGKSPREAGDYASVNTLTKQVIATTNSKGETIFVTPFKHINENYVLHDGNGNPYMNPNLEYVWDESDWDVYDAVFSRKLRQEYNVDISGQSNNGKTSYFLSGGYLDDLGYNMDQYYKRYSFRSNIDVELKEWWSAGGNLSYSSHRQNLGGKNNRALIFSTTLASPWLRNEDNTDWVYSEKTGKRMYNYSKYTTNYYGTTIFDYPGDYWDNDNDDSFNNNMGHITTAQAYTEFKLPFNIKYRAALNIDDYWHRTMGYGSAVHGISQTPPYGISITPNGGHASRSNFDKRATTWNNVLSGDWTFNNDHTLSVMAGHEWYTWNTHFEEAKGYGIMELGKFELSNTTKDFSATGGRNEYALLSFFGKADYNFRNKYYLSASIREDGSSRFHPDNRWGTFWSAGASWHIAKERFMEHIPWLNNLSLRGSYGTTGNDRLITRITSTGKSGSEVFYAYQGTYTGDDLYLQPGLKPNTSPTPNIKWESNHQWNVGLDFSVFNRISGTVEYYSRTSKDLLYYKDAPLSAQVGNATGYNTNIGDLRNSGIELTINANVVTTKDFSWDINANLSTLKNEVVYLPSGPYTYSGTACYYKMEEGKSIYEFIAPQYDGVNPETGTPGWLIRDGNGGWKRTENPTEVTTDDFVYCGSAIPNLFGSITNNVQYKGFDLSFMFYYSYGSKMADYAYKERILNIPGVSMVQELVEDRWKKPGDAGTTIPRWSYTQYGATVKYATNFVFDNHYWRLRNLTFGYTLPKALSRKYMIENLRFYVTGNNLLTFGPAKDRYTDPETGVRGNSFNGNDDNNSGHQGSRRLYMFGVQITL